MEAYFLVRHGNAETAFEKRALVLPAPGPGQVRIRVEAFGLNFADVMARHGMYKDAPPLPAVLGYEAVGRIDACGENVKDLSPGQRVVAFTRFGAYATHVITQRKAVAKIPDDMDACRAAALATQYCTAWYAAEECMKLRAGERVLVQAAAGGVGTALVQIAKRRGCIVIGTAGSAEKLDYLERIGVDHPINYRAQDFSEAIVKLFGEKSLDAVFDAVGGKSFKKGFRLLRAGGRIVGYGAAERLEKRNFFSTLGLVLGFGFYHPVALLMSSRALIGVNMLRIADQQPDVLQHCLDEVVRLTLAGELDPQAGAVFPADELGKAHAFLESRKSVGKIVVKIT